MSSASDGLQPWKGRAGDVRVGHLIQGSKATKNDVWRVVEMRNPDQIEYGRTLWWKVENLATGEWAPIPPKSVKAWVTYMLDEAEFEYAEAYGRPPHFPQVWPMDAEQVALLVDTLGATALASQDNETGEIWCPNYAAGHTATGWRNRVTEQFDHLRLCHGMDVRGLEAITDWEHQMLEVTRVHGVAHRDDQPGGFPHRHVPEDRSLL